MLHHSGHDRPGQSGYAVNMLTPCPQCGHALWSEVCCIEAFRCVLYFDDEHGEIPTPIGLEAAQSAVCSCSATPWTPQSSQPSSGSSVSWSPEAPVRTKGESPPIQLGIARYQVAGHA